MSWNRVAEHRLLRNFTFQLYNNLCGRTICTSTSLFCKSRRMYEGYNFNDEEAEDFTADDMEQLTNMSADDIKSYASQIERDSVKFQRFIQQKTIGHKYFKMYEPQEENLLTWEMKEQLRYLHATDPDEWTPEVLAAAFPVSITGVQKLLKTKWVPESETAIKRHDTLVLERWKKYTNGRLGNIKLVQETLKRKLSSSSNKLPVLMADHSKVMSTLESLKFENYEDPQEKNVTQKHKVKTKKIKSGSFVSIIEDYEAQVSQNKGEKQSQSSENEPSATGHNDVALNTFGTPEYHGSYSRINSTVLPRQRGRNRLSNQNRLMTLEEFLSTKSESGEV